MRFYTVDDLLVAVCCGELWELKKILKTGVDVDGQSDVGLTALHHAVGEDSPERVNLLMEAGASARIRDVNGATAIFLGAELGKGEGIKALAKHGVDPNEVGKAGNRPLHVASAGQETKALVALLELGADVNAQREDGDTALHVAATNSSAEKASLLIKAGAGLGICNNAGLTPHGLFLAEGNILGEDLEGLLRLNYH